jgi:putative ABC transport system permease protein
MAMGAQRRDLVSFVLRQAAVMIGTGVVIGLAAAWLLTGFLSRLLYGVAATDWIAYAIATALLVFTALLAAFLPARRASRTDPVAALR